MRNNQTTKTLIIITLICHMTFCALFSMTVISLYAHHKHIDNYSHMSASEEEDDCPICKIVEFAKAFIKHSGGVVIPVYLFITAAIAVLAGILHVMPVLCHNNTLIAQKIRMNN